MATTMPASNGSYTDNTMPTSAGSGTAGSGFANNADQTTNGPEEVGWYFVEQYYTTLNKSPERLHLFYNKRSTFVWGNEGETIVMSHGRTEIGDKIKALDFRECKVRVTNVDSVQSINNGIVVQVLGQMTNNSEPNRRFSQTFFLAEQVNGFYVLNDIFRYLKEDDEDEEEEIIPDSNVEVAEEAHPEAVKNDEPSKEEVVPEEQEDLVVKDVAAESSVPDAEPITEVNGTSKTEPEITPEEETPAEKETELVAPINTGAHIAPLTPAVPALPTPLTKTEDSPAPAVPSTPSPANVPETKSASPAKEETPAASAPPKPNVPKTWANLVAAGAKTVASTVSSAAAAVAPTTAPTKETSKESNNNSARPTTPNTPATPSSGGWQTTDTRRQSRPVSMSGPPEGQTQAYVKHVNERVNPTALKEALSKFGTIKHFEIVKARSCAFVDFAEPSQFLAAAAANPHRIGDQNVFVEERKQRPTGAPFNNNRGGPQGGRGDRGNQGGRGGFQRSNTGERFEGGRGGFEGGRGGNMGGRQGSGRGGSFSRGRGAPAAS